MNFEDAYLKLVTRATSKNSVVIDIGCGDNSFIDKIQKKWGIGIDSERHHNLVNRSFILANVEHIPLPDKVCDTTLCCMSIEHFKNPELVMGEIYRILNKGGLFIFATPDKYYPASLVAKLLCPFHIIQKSLIGFRLYDVYYRLNTIHSIRKCLSSFGFSEVELIRTYEDTYTESSWINKVLAVINGIYRSKLHTILPPHHLIGVYRKI
jgi:ubiquinone/menaquinone biosynthesis C-methylase UbiE